MNARTALGAGLAAMSIGWLAACATMSVRQDPAEENYLSGEELAGSNSRTVYEALERLRPQWLTSRGPVSATDPTLARPNVYMNGARIGDLDYLRQVNVIDVGGVRFWTAAEASARFGMGNPRGVIEIIGKE